MAICHNEAGPPPYVPVPGSLLFPFPIKTRYVLGRRDLFLFFDVLAKILKKNGTNKILLYVWRAGSDLEEDESEGETQTNDNDKPLKKWF